MIPSFQEFMHPLLAYLAAHPMGAQVSEVYSAVAGAVGVSQAECSILLPSGTQALYKNRIGWAHDRLKRAGFSTSPKRGTWKITEEGLAFANAHPSGISDEEKKRLAYPPSARTKKTENGDEASLEAPDTPDDSTRSPTERIETAVQEVEDSVTSELLEIIGRATPLFFENLVLDLLHAMGYGTSRTDLQRVGGSGDGGIDGIISLDRLGLQKVYVQAKRWKGSVGRPELQAFYGALAGRRATKGVFITTSHYTREAQDFAKDLSETIVTVDGQELGALMIEHGVGVDHKALKLPRVDSDYFED